MDRAPSRRQPPIARSSLLKLAALIVCAVSPARASASENESASEPGLRDGDPLPASDLLTRGRLDNGVAYWIQPVRAPVGSVSIWLRIGSGSLNERRDQRGLAHFVEHMAFSGTRNFPRGEAIRSFESLGLRFGQDENGSTDLRDTIFQLALPDTRPETIQRALTLMADFAFRQTLRPADIDRERHVVLEELRAAQGLGERIDDRLRALLYAGSRVAARPPRGDPSVVGGATRADLLAYLDRWYRPDDATLMVAGDVDPARLVPLIAGAFGEWRAGGRRARDADPGVGVPPAARAAVIADAGMPLARVSLDWISPLGPLRTVGDYRRRLVDELAIAVLDRRLDRRARTTAPSFQSAYAESQAAFGSIRRVAVEVFSRAARWREALGAALEEIEEARGRGCDDEALAEVTRARLARAERDFAGEPARAARELLAEMREALDEGRIPLSKAQALALDRALLPEITPSEVGDALARTFDARVRQTALILPRRPGLRVPTRGQLVAAGRTGDGPLAAATTRGPHNDNNDDDDDARDPHALDRLLDAEPEPAATRDAAATPPIAGVTSLTLANGVRVHLRPMADHPRAVELQVTLAGAELLETAETRGLSAAAAVAFAHPATARHSAEAIHRYLAARNVRPWGCACEGDGITLGISTDAAGAEEAMRLAHLELTEGRIDGASFRLWKDRRTEEAAPGAASPERQLDERVAGLIADGDARARPPGAGDLARIDRDAARRWLDRQRAEAPIEVALVGDLPLARMRALAERYLGSLPARPSIDHGWPARPALAARRPIAFGRGPFEVSVPIDTSAPRAVVALGWRGVDAGDEHDRQVLDLAARIISDRLIEELRERRGLAYRFSCDSMPAVALSGTGTLTLQIATDPRRARVVATLARALVEQLAREGPTAGELTMARRQRAHERRQDEGDPDFWADTLSTLDLRAIALEEVADELALLERITAPEVGAALARYVSEDRRFQAMALPRPSLLVQRTMAPAAVNAPAKRRAASAR